MRTAPRFDSAEQAAEIAENYWMALTRDISFTDYQNNPLIGDAARDLSRYSDFRAPKAPGGSVTPSQIFRGVTRGDLIGPYISQFFWKETPFGSETIDRRMQTAAPFSDYMTTYSEWLAIQNGATARPQSFDATLRYIRNGRDLGEWVHRDVLFQAYFEALLILFRIGAPIDANNPYAISRSQIGFGTLGDPFIASVLCAVATRALKAVWYQKWFVHRRLRPEVFAGRIHNHVNRNATYPIHGEILNSTVLGELHRRNGSYLLPMVFPEGSPLHPSFGAGHATVAGACVTILKAFFDESFVIPDPVEADSDGLRLHPYSGPPLTVGGELDKLASNVAIGRNIAGVHWRSDATESMRLGEEVAIRFLQEERGCLNERFDGFSLTRFDGSTVIV
jgi:membrane-associated phospholipid phosphatase